MDAVSRTLYIPLYGKALVSKRGLFIKDGYAERIWDSVQFPLRGKAKSKWLAFYMGIRAAVFDEWVKAAASEEPQAVVLHLGAGLDSRAVRTGVKNTWYDVDFSAVIDERRKYYSEGDTYKMICSDIRDGAWLNTVCEADTAIVVMEGVAMYLSPTELDSLMSMLGARFSKIRLLMDFYTPFGAKMSRCRNPVSTVGVGQVFGIDRPENVGTGVFMSAVAREMTPKKYIDELCGIEKFVFRTLYAGGVSGRIYRIFEYQK